MVYGMKLSLIWHLDLIIKYTIMDLNARFILNAKNNFMQSDTFYTIHKIHR